MSQQLKTYNRFSARRLAKKSTDGYKEALQKLQDLNQTCSDCTEKHPTWASLNLGILICSNCSGVHRNMGTHISKVRSCTLYEWNSEMIKGMKTNDQVNANYEWHVPKQYPKPHCDSPIMVRETYIRQKYEHKTFHKSTKDNLEKPGQPPCYHSPTKDHHARMSIESNPALIEYNGILTIFVINGIDYPDADLMSESDPYAVFMNGKFQTARTKHIDCNDNPMWNEMLSLTVRTDWPIQIMVFDYNYCTKDNLIAAAEFNILDYVKPGDDMTMMTLPCEVPDYYKSQNKKPKICFQIQYTEIQGTDTS